MLQVVEEDALMLSLYDIMVAMIGRFPYFLKDTSIYSFDPYD